LDGGCLLPDSGPDCDLAECPHDVGPAYPPGDPFCQGSPGFLYTAMCNPTAAADLDQILDAGSCADLLPTAFPQHPYCDGQLTDLPK
jgi:hypothetical protein